MYLRRPARLADGGLPVALLVLALGRRARAAAAATGGPARRPRGLRWLRGPRRSGGLPPLRPLTLPQRPPVPPPSDVMRGAGGLGRKKKRSLNGEEEGLHSSRFDQRRGWSIVPSPSSKTPGQSETRKRVDSREIVLRHATRGVASYLAGQRSRGGGAGIMRLRFLNFIDSSDNNFPRQDRKRTVTKRIESLG